ncbi:uncharacterized protein TNCV_2374961 [Trichonephila clavipes]|nr:uncharacterized protein TNCV_2374961 [Trichonephila clavipes]
MRPVPHSEELPIPKPPEHLALDEESSNSDRKDLNDLIRDLKLSKKQSEMLGSGLNGWNLLQKYTKTCTYRSRHSQCKDYFSKENGLVFCNDISSLMETFGIEHNPIEWRLFIDSSKASLKTVLRHNGNKFPSIPVAHSASMKETHENFQFILAKLQYAVHERNMCDDLKVIALILGL